MTNMTTAATWDETKIRREPRGRFADKPHTAPEADLAVMPDYSDSIDESYPIPQANSLQSVSATVDAVAADVDTPSAVAQALDMDDRQGAYYLNAAGYLGLVEVDRDYESGAAVWRLTALGEAMTHMDDDQRSTLIAQLAESTPAVAGYREAGITGAENAIAEHAELGDDTTSRRAATAASWAAAIDSRDFAQFTAEVTELARDRFTAAAAVAKAEREAHQRARQVIAPQVCPECFTEIPVSGICGFCG